MPWTKDIVSLAPKIVYTAPASVLPIVRIIYDPKAKKNPWMVEYAYVNTPTSTLADIETLMGL